jgi:hypothetical protein
MNMITRCRHCLTKAEPQNSICPVCGLVPGKRFRNLTHTEKRVWLHVRGIRVVAMCHLIGAIMGILMMPGFAVPFAIVMFSIINLLLAYGLIRYSLLAYKLATAYYFLVGMVMVISIQQGIGPLLGILLALTALYLVGNRTAKAVFERRVPEALYLEEAIETP